MHYVGVDLHKKTISVCVVIQEASARRVLKRHVFECRDIEAIERFFAGLGCFQVVVEATASYEWFVQLIEQSAERVVLAHPSKLRVITESTRKTDKLDAQVLAEFLALDMIPEAWRPTPRVREHRVLVRQRHYLRKRITSVRNKVRHLVANYNGDVPELFTPAGRQHLSQLPLTEADRFVVDMLLTEFDQHQERLRQVTAKLKDFARQAGVAEREAREVLGSIPYVGPVTIDIVLAEVGDIRRFGSQRKATAYAGLAPGVRESAGRRKNLGSPRPARGCFAGRWSKPLGAWSGRLDAGASCTTD